MNPHYYLVMLSSENNPKNEIIKELLPIEGGLEAVVLTSRDGYKKVEIGDFYSFEDKISDDIEIISKALSQYFCYGPKKKICLGDYEKDFKPLFYITRRGKLSH